MKTIKISCTDRNKAGNVAMNASKYAHITKTLKQILIPLAMLLIILCFAFSGCASSASKTEDGILEATISVSQGFSSKDVKECVVRAFIARRYQNIEVSDGKISGIYKRENLITFKLTAIYSTNEVKLYGGKIEPSTFGARRPKRWVKGVERDIAAFFLQKTLLGEKQ